MNGTNGTMSGNGTKEGNMTGMEGGKMQMGKPKIGIAASYNLS